MKKSWTAPEITFLNVKNTQGDLHGTDNDGFFITTSDPLHVVMPLTSGGTIHVYP